MHKGATAVTPAIRHGLSNDHTREQLVRTRLGRRQPPPSNSRKIKRLSSATLTFPWRVFDAARA